MLTVGAYLLLSFAIGSSITSRIGALRRRSALLALPSMILVALAMFVAPIWGAWIFVPLVLAAVLATLVIVREVTVGGAVQLFLLGIKVLLLAVAGVVAGLCRLGLLGVIPDELIGAAVTALGGATAVVVGFDFSDSPGLSHVDYDSEDPKLEAARTTQRIIWWRIISSGVIFIAILLMVIAPQADAAALSRPVGALVLALAAVGATVWGVTRVMRLARSQPPARLGIGTFAPLVVANVFAIGVAVNALLASGLPSITPFAAVISLLLVVWFAEELFVNAALNAVRPTAGAILGCLVCTLTPVAAFLTLASPPAASTAPTMLDSLLVVAIAALVSVATFTAIGRLIFRWPSRTLQPAFIALLVDTLMYWWVVLTAGLVVSLSDTAQDNWVVTVILSVGAAVVVSVILYNDVQHYEDQARRTKDPASWPFGEEAGGRFRRLLAGHLGVQWTTGLLIVAASSLAAFGVLGTAQLLSG